MSPLGRRLPRELLHNLGKCLGLFFLITLTIAMVSGYLVAARSIQRVVADEKASANLEDFTFSTQFKTSDAALDAVESVGSGCTVWEDFYSDASLGYEGSTADITVRLIKNRTDFDKASYLEGSAPSSDGQIALSRTFCVNNGLSVGDTVSVSGHELTICGLVALPDYQALVKRNSDLMFDGTTFTVAQVTPSAFDELADSVIYHYAAVLDDGAMSLVDRTDFELDVASALSDHDVTITDLHDRVDNTALNFADDDLEGDQLGWVTICGIIMVISAFVFVVLTDATIEQESAVIGTLLASGYRKGELVRHYLALPILVGLLAAVVGNALGYGWLVRYMSGLYYGSYDLPTYVTTFSPEVFVMTTVVPVVMLIVITLVGITRKLGASPLAFLRHEVGRRSRRSTLGLPERWGFVARFRTRVLLRNASHFVVLFLGIMLSSMLLLFGLCLLPIVRNYANQMAATVPADHLYLLKAPLEIDVSASQRDGARAADELMDYEDPEDELSAEDCLKLLSRASTIAEDSRVLAGHPLNTQANSSQAVEDAEKFAVTSLDLPRQISDKDEEVSIYGIDVGSSYWKFDVSGGKIVMGAGLAAKCGVKVGQQFTFTDPYTGDEYVLSPDVIAGEQTDTNVYMSRATWCELFGKDASYFNGYASDAVLRLNERYLASEVTPAQMSIIADQMETSMGKIMGMILWLAVPISIVLIYLLTKTVIDRSARYISYMKVFGYHDAEIQRLYVRSITITVVASLVLSLPANLALIGWLMTFAMSGYSGNIPLTYPTGMLAETLGIGLAAYLVVAVVHVLRIRRVSLAEALKVQE